MPLRLTLIITVWLFCVKYTDKSRKNKKSFNTVALKSVRIFNKREHFFDKKLDIQVKILYNILHREATIAYRDFHFPAV